ncbi:hypothetical protein HanRHA438_Chr03g0106651 [Helianthus annuus]|nr:hypothetical protein HanIR_Chr03g0104311 [Helianthus annuus]KAJ0934371.1 hypothetical protein HanRHA438_Chr03g0106651 [Helianthus annuus]
MLRGSKKAKTSGQGSSSGAGSGSGVYQRRWEQLSNVEEGDGQLERQDWAWEEAKNSGSASKWKEEKTKALSRYKNKKLEAKMWKMKMVTGISKPVPDRAVCERTVDIEEFRKIGIVQRFEKLGWERVIDWCDDITNRVYLAAVCEWLSTLRFEHSDRPAHMWKLIGNIGKNQMVMSFEHMNAIARFDSLGVDAYDYYEYDQFLDNKRNDADPVTLLEDTLPGSGGSGNARADLSLMGKILQGISLENIMVRFGDRGTVKAPDCRVVRALLYGTPKLSWRQIVMINTWDTRESFKRKMIPYPRLISAMILQQNALPQDSLWVSKPIDQFNFASMRRHWNITVKSFGHLHTVEDDQGDSYRFNDEEVDEEGEEEGGDEEMPDVEEDIDPSGPWGPRRRYRKKHREISANVADFVNQRQIPSYRLWNRADQGIYDNVSTGIGEAREYHASRKEWEEAQGAYSQQQWGFQSSFRERVEKQLEEQQLQHALQQSQMERMIQLQEEERAHRQAWEEEDARRRNAQAELDQRRWGALAFSNQMAINNFKVLHDQERHQRDYQAGLPYAEHSGWTDYPNLPHPRGPADPIPHWPEAVGSSFVPMPYQPPPQQESSPLDNYRDMLEALTGYPYQPNPPVNPNERYQR